MVRVLFVFGTMLIALTAWVILTADEIAKSVEPDSLLPSDAQFYLCIRSGPEVQEAWNQSAAHKALIDGGLLRTIDGLIRGGIRAMGANESGADQQQWLAYESLVDDLLSQILQHGVVAGGTLDAASQTGEFTVILPNVPDAFATQITDVLRAIPFSNEPVVEESVAGREITGRREASGGVFWWREGSHLVLTAGQIEPSDVVSRVGSTKTFADSENYKQAKATKSFVIAGEIWFQVGELVNMLPLMDPALERGARTLGLDGVESVRVSWGYEKEAMRTEYDVHLSSSSQGLFATSGERALSLDELPRLPSDVDYVAAGAWDFGKTYELFLELLDPVASLGDVESPGPSMRESIQRFETEKSIQISKMVASLGEVGVVYSSATDGPLGFFGISAAVSVKDRRSLETSLDRLAAAIAELDPNILIERKEIDGVTYWMGGYRGPIPISPSIALSDKWLVATPLSPGPVLRFMRLQTSDGPAWTAKAHSDRTAMVKGRQTSYAYFNPKPLIQTVNSILPFIASGMNNSLTEFEFDPVQLPNTDVILDSVFPGTSVAYMDEAGWHLSSRHCLPLTGSELAFVAGSSPSAGVVAALLLPVFNRVRDNARQTMDKANLKQVGVSLHMANAEVEHLPRGTPEQAFHLPVDQRLSWMATLLPYLEEGAAELALDKPWNGPENDPITRKSMRVFLNPRLEGQNTNQTHYVGMAGVGKDAAKLPDNDPKAGIFGYDRQTSFKDIRDGASNTIAVIGIEKNPGPWGQGGPSTIRGLSEKPYIGGKDGFGGQSRGVNVLMADGSVLFISETIDARVLESLATKSGGEVIPFGDEP